MKRFFAFLSVALVVAAGCGSDDDDKPKVGNGVNNLRAACDIRQGWNRSAENCSICEAAVVSPRCECEALKAFSAACSNQDAAMKTSCDEGIRNCALGCIQDDCACLDGCYANAPPACRQAADARDGCVAEACTQFCN
ncbi:MAG: hypothetical protein KIT84_12155 [Labilithrix sp.]|nr:hypothetical protein [Labilithrix sp.]MCW5811765.1 hypothetical protein [Labilithrix sp.]